MPASCAIRRIHQPLEPIMSQLTIILVLILVPSVITNIILRGLRGAILSENGYKSIPFFILGTEMLDMGTLIGKIEDPKLKRKYKRLQRSITIINLLIICVVIVLIKTGFDR